MAWTRKLVKVEDIDIEEEQHNPDTYRKVYVYDGSGDYSPDKSKRLIVWIDVDDDDEYPRQHAVWYPVGAEIPLEVWEA